jgi:hypothetical protein
VSHQNSQYWQLVEELMLCGWYRDGQDRKRDPSGFTWHFREGHTTDSQAISELWILAPSEMDAMRILADELRQIEMARLLPSTSRERLYG